MLLLDREDYICDADEILFYQEVWICNADCDLSYWEIMICVGFLLLWGSGIGNLGGYNLRGGVWIEKPT